MQVKHEISQVLDKGKVQDSALFVVKIPIPLYHQTDRKHFESVQGEFEYKGKFYEMVKQKVENDTLFVYCLNNESKAGLFTELSEHTQSHIIDFSGSQPNPFEKLVKSFIKEYLPDVHYEINLALFVTDLQSVSQSDFLDFTIPAALSEIPTPPPQVL
jgi:hypothetical protein